jgi:hypothetical protein
MVLAAMALLQVAGWAEAKDRTQPRGGGYVDTKHPKLGKDYYVVRMGVGDKCSIVSGEQQASSHHVRSLRRNSKTSRRVERLFGPVAKTYWDAMIGGFEERLKLELKSAPDPRRLEEFASVRANQRRLSRV